MCVYIYIYTHVYYRHRYIDSYGYIAVGGTSSCSGRTRIIVDYNNNDNDTNDYY